MELTQTPSRIHPLLAGAAVSVTLVSLLGVAALSGLLPTSHGSAASQSTTTTAAVADQNALAVTPNALTAATVAQNGTAPVLVKTASGYQYMQPVAASAPTYQGTTPAYQAPAPTYHASTTAAEAPVYHAPHHRAHHYAHTYAQADTGYRGEVRQPSYQQPAYQAPRNSPVGIATGAVVGGLLGSQVGGGNGRTLATVAGAVGGGYLGNKMGQQYGY